MLDKTKLATIYKSVWRFYLFAQNPKRLKRYLGG